MCTPLFVQYIVTNFRQRPLTSALANRSLFLFQYPGHYDLDLAEYFFSDKMHEGRGGNSQTY